MATAEGCASSKALPQANLAIHLLSGLAADLPLHWLPVTPSTTTFPPPLTRSLLSLLLRTSSPSESLAASSALLHAQTLVQSSPAACLGFPADASPEAIHRVLHDLLLSAARGDALLLDSPALTLYADAGPDADEYANPTPDPRVAHANPHQPLAAIRCESLARAIVVFAHAFQDPSTKKVLLDQASHNMSRFLAPLLDHLPDNVAFLPNNLREAVQQFYANFAEVAPEQMREDFSTRLVCSLMRLASVHPAGISPFMHGMANAHIRLKACRMCLVQRFGVKDPGSSTTFSVHNINNYLKVAPQKGRHNSAVPPLLTTLLMSWYHIGDEETFVFDTKPTDRAARLVRRICVVRSRIEKFGASKRDTMAFNSTVLLLAGKITECASLET